MKLRDFVANSLPRVRGRKKKGQVVNGTAVSITAAVVAATTAAASGSGTKATNGTTTSPAKAEAHNPTSPRPGRQDGNGNWFQFGAESRFGFLEKLVGKESPVKRLFENRNRHVVTAPKCDKRQNSRTDDDDDDDDVHIKTVSSPRYCPSSAVTEPSSPYGSVGGVRSPPLGEKPVFHSQHASPVCSSWAAHERYSDWDCSSFYTVGHGYPDSVTSFESSTPGSQRGPRSRSRIRTNPWLPSPRPSPYSVRSLSSPCPSSRSQSPSSSPAPPSSSDSTSPLTSFSSDVSATRETQLHRHRRHRRHHSEVKASDLTRHIAFETHHTDTEQYYSTLDSGIGDIATSSSEKDKHKVTTSRKQRNLNTKRRSVDRDLELVKNFTIAASSASPKSKPKFRVKARSSCPSSSSKALIANRDSKFWDSDSSSRSPPTRSRSLGNSKDSLHFETAHLERCVVSERSRAVPGTFGELVPGYLPGEFFCEADSVDFYAITGVHESSVLSPCDDICVITSNIEQLAQNISSEYEDSADVSFESTLDSSKQEDKSDSLRDLYNIDSEETLILQTSGSGVSTVLDYATFAEALQCTDSLRTESRDTLLDNTLTDTSNQHVVSSEELPTVDVAVQTDFDDEEDNSSSDWLASTESSSDWVTSNGSGSEWLASGGSGWQTGEGSGCATEEEEEEEEEEESTLWVEGSRLWLVPDIMQNSTDTGYSSLSRDGRIVTDDNNNNNNSHNNNNNNNNNTTTNNNNIAANAEYSSDSTTTTSTTADDKMSKASDSDVMSQTASNSTKCSDIVVASGAVPKRNVIRKLPKHKPSSEMSENAGDLCSQRISCTFEFNIMGGNCSRKGALGGNQSGMCSARMKDKSEHCSWDADCSGSKDSQEDASPQGVHRSCRRKVDRHSSYDHVVPYPYDVTRFSDVILPPDERGRSVSPCVLHDQLSTRSEEAKELEGPFQLPSTIFTSTPRNHGSEAGEEDFCSCLDTSMTSEKNDITNPEEEGNFESSRASKLALVPSSKRFLPPRLFDNPPSTGRNLQQVKASLEDKVQFLRQGKRIVSRKIREAREEEMVRQQQKLRFQRLLDIHRKRILLETLQDLRQRLESQSARLQASYSAVLDLQKRYV